MAHYCICPKCTVRFDRDSIQAVKLSARRYGHLTCYPDNTDLVPLVIKQSDNPDMKALNDYIKQIYGDKANWALIKKQTKDFQEKGYSLTGILKSLVYFYDVKKNSIEKSNGGIGIVEFTYQKAYEYYLSLFLANQINENIDNTFINKIKEIEIAAPTQRKITKKLFDMDWSLEDEEQE